MSQPAFDERSIREWIKANMDAKLAEFGIPNWRATVEYRHIEGVVMQVTPYPEYEKANIVVNLGAVLDECADIEAVEKVLEHELMHCVCSNLNRFASASMEDVLDGDAWNTFATGLNQAWERDVRNLERLVFAQRNANRTQP